MGMMELFTMGGRIVTNADEAHEGLDKVTNKAKESEGKMGSAFKRIGNAIVEAFDVDKVIDFGKKMVETTANIQALDSQFTQTFKGDQAKAMELITKQAKDQNIFVDRLKGTWSSFYGTFRGNGANANESLDLTKRYMKSAADAAAYYDTSLEDVVGSLKSITMGNFEAGDAIGVNINATKMDTIAKEKYKKSWEDLNDTQKEFLLIDTVEGIYKNSGAMGQASREASNYSNVVENLKATWERFISVFGAPVLDVVVGVLKNITDTIQQLTAKAQSFNLGTFMSQLSDAGGIAGNLGNTINSLKNIFFTLRDGFIEIVSDITKTAQDWYNKNQNTINKIIQTFNDCLNVVKGIIQDSIKLIMNIWDAFGAHILDGTASSLQTSLEWILNILTILREGFFQLVSAIIKTAEDWFNNNQDTVNRIIQIFNNCLTMVKSIIQDGTTIIMAIWNTFGKYIFDIAVAYLGWILEKVQAVLLIISGVFHVVASLIKGDWQGVWDGIKAILFGALEYLYMLIIEKLIGAIVNQIKGFGSKVSEVFSSIKNYIAEIWTSISSSVSGAVERIAAKLEGTFGGLKGTVSKIWSGIKDAIWSPISEAEQLLQKFVGKVKSWFTDLFPKIKLPHFTLSGSIDPLKWFTQGVPKLGVEWYAEGGIMTKPMAFGINPTTGNVMAGGEPSTGGEAIMPLNKLPELMAEAIRKVGFGNNIVQVMLPDGRILAELVAENQDVIDRYNSRELGGSFK
ncbi:hypothetical protein CSC2_12530 [Clostridium zeae]|uniref:Uncharacterized protein n=1 Tax=Clostridium zeae TaxID=2759022 RepID=A0ABQ1E7H1_9CLOT|nr:hypothetical protein [Clostridium zeae]GFZ30727.1 hypothetical protein CSC2_12530 [Clostridium zeae]